MEQQSKKIKQVIEVALLTSGKPLSVEDFQKLFIEKIEPRV